MGKIKKFFSKKLNVLVTAILVFVLLCSISAVCMFTQRVGERSTEIWTPNSEFTLEDSVVIQKEAGTDFKILNFADIQIGSPFEIFKSTNTYKTMKACVEEVQPNLITLSGDNSHGYLNSLTTKKLRQL
jgi:hypothetical protein